jgi:hypothetical protein
MLCLLLSGLPAAAAGPGKVLTFTDDSGRTVRTKTLPDPHFVHLRSGTVDLRQFAAKANGLGRESVPLIVSFDRALSADLTRTLEATGAQVIGPLPPAAYLVRANRWTAANIANLDGFAAMAPFQDQWKISGRVPRDAEMAEVEIVLFAHADEQLTLETARQWGTVLSKSEALDRHIIHAVLPREAIDHIASLADVEMIDGISQGGLFNNQVRVVMQTEKQHQQANQAFYNPIYNLGVFGAGEIVTVADSGLQNHEVYASNGKILANFPAPNSCITTTGDEKNHGTGVVATLLGDKISSGGLFGTANDMDGLALQASVVMQDIENASNFCPPTEYALDLFLPAWQNGSMVHSNSWGYNGGINGPGGSYSLRSQIIDDYMSRPIFREHVIVFSAGNAGASYPGQVYRPFTLSDESHSKNAIIVGGSGNGNNRDSMYLYSSRGPTSDCLGCFGLQRVKPDVLAPATVEVDTADTSGYSAYSQFSGTSIAAPAVAAAAVLIRDYFGQGIYPVKASDPPLGGPPSAALVKAMLINSTVPIYDSTGYEGNLARGLAADAYPNYDQGYGRPVLENVLEPASYRKLKAYEDATTTVDTGDLWQRTVKFRETWLASCSSLRITLVWSDPEGTLAAGPKLVNDLDLEVTFQGSTYRGNHRLTGNAFFDSVNNVEDVFLPMDPYCLGYQLKPVVRVFGTSVPKGPQAFAVVATYGACADNLPCDPPQSAQGCYRGPSDTVPGATFNRPQGCGNQTYSSSNYGGNSTAFPLCDPPTLPTPDPGEQRFPTKFPNQFQVCPAPGGLP